MVLTTRQSTAGSHRLGCLTMGAAIVAVVTTLGAQPAQAAGHCMSVGGKFSSLPVTPPLCTSPVGFCTHGRLRGALAGSYDFTMNTLIPAGDPSIPGVVFFTGTSLITPRRGGSIVGTDSGAIDLSPFGSAKMASLITLIDGADGLEGAGGYLQLRGGLDFATGGVTGDYHGELCLP
ncbi:MAG: hypothetical protein AAB426_10420 [Myxococcota bacterium]